MAKKQVAAQQPQLTPEDSAQVLVGELLDAEKPIAGYDPLIAKISALTEKHGKVVFDVSTTKGLDEAKAARMEIREVRFAIEHTRKAIKAPVLRIGERIDEYAKTYTAQLTALEKPIDDQIKARETAIEQEKAAKAKRDAEERRRVEQALADLQFYVVEAAGKSIERMQELHAELTAKELTAEEFGDKLPEAVLARNTTANRLQGMIDTAVAAAAEAKRLAEEAERQRQEREELERQRRELEARMAELNPAPTFEENMEKSERISAAITPPPEQDDSKPFGGVPVRWISQEEARELYPPQQPQADVDDSDPFGTPQIPGFDVAGGDDATGELPLSALAATDDEPAAPTLSELVEIIADEYDVDDETAERWLRAAVAGA